MFIINDLVIEMENLGHEITVLTGKPNYPEGKVFTGYRASGLQTETYGKNIKIYRVPLRARGSGGAFNLALNYLSYVFSASFFGPWLLRRKSFDVIFGFAPSPITQALPAISLRFIKKIPFIFWVQDLWPESLVATKFVKNKVILKSVEFMVRFIYRYTDLILVQSPSFIAPVRKLAPTTEIAYYPNSFKKMEEMVLQQVPQAMDSILENSFCVLFAGNIGQAQSVETIVAAALKVTDLVNLKIIFVGSGSKLNWIQQKIIELQLTNIFCAGRFELASMPAIYAKAKALLLTLNADEILQYTLPWKTQAYLAAGRPIIGAIDGEGARVITEAQCGLVGPAENVQDLANHIRQVYLMPEEERNRLGLNGKHYFLKNFEMQGQVKNLLSVFATQIIHFRASKS